MIRSSLLILILGAAFAAEEGPATDAPAPVLHVQTGEVSGEAGAALDVAAGARITVGSQPAALAVVGAEGTLLRFSPDSRLRAVREGGLLVIELEAGSVEADLAARGPYENIVVRGAAVEVVPHGTLFVVSRVRKDADYVALSRGQVSVGLRESVARLLGRQRVDLDGLRGVGASTTRGLGASESLPGQVTIASARAGGAAAGGNAVIGSSLLPGIELPGGGGGASGAPGGEDLLSPQITGQIQAEIAAQIAAQIAEQVSEQVSQQVVEQLLGATPAGPLGGPPGPPN